MPQRFVVHMGGRVVAGFSKMSRLPTQRGTASEAITLERGVTHDTEFEQWVATGEDGARNDVKIEMRELDGTAVRRMSVHRCWVSEYQAMPELDASANAVLIETLELSHDGIKVTP